MLKLLGEGYAVLWWVSRVPVRSRHAAVAQALVPAGLARGVCGWAPETAEQCPSCQGHGELCVPR